MTSRDFCYWLQGFFEVAHADGQPVTADQARIIQKHLALVFAHEIDPSAGDAKAQEKLNAIHGPPRPDGVTYRC